MTTQLGADCIAVGTGAGATETGVDRTFECNFVGVGLCRTVMTEEEARIVKRVILRMVGVKKLAA
jgi:hypothetical protein